MGLLGLLPGVQLLPPTLLDRQDNALKEVKTLSHLNTSQRDAVRPDRGTSGQRRGWGDAGDGHLEVSG